MGVYIKDMDMPKNCYLCRYSVCGRVTSKLILHCGVAESMDFMEALEHRHKDCPLVEVKAQHGRLIDADLLKSWHEDGYVSLDDIREAPTIIEAEGKDDG